MNTFADFFCVYLKSASKYSCHNKYSSVCCFLGAIIFPNKSNFFALCTLLTLNTFLSVFFNKSFTDISSMNYHAYLRIVSPLFHHTVYFTYNYKIWQLIGLHLAILKTHCTGQIYAWSVLVWAYLYVFDCVYNGFHSTR